MKVGDIIEDLEVYAEICCDYCNEIIHNHISCPVCKKSYAGTEAYHELWDDTELTCECGTVFEKISGSWYGLCEVKIKSIKNKNNESTDIPLSTI